MAKTLIGFIVGCLLVTFLMYRQTTNNMHFTCPRIEIPACPEIPECKQNPLTLKSLEIHQELLMECYGKIQKSGEDLENCRNSEVSLKGEIEDWRSRYTNQCGGGVYN